MTIIFQPQSQADSTRPTIRSDRKWAALLAPVLIAIAVSAHPIKSRADEKEDHEPIDLSPFLAELVETDGVPALAAWAAREGRVVAKGVAGRRSVPDGPLVTLNDPFHLGSCTKAMTATLAAILIQEGRLDWDATVIDVFPDWDDQIDSGYHDVTVEQLLRHRGGVPAELPPPGSNMRALYQLEGSPLEQRRIYLKAKLQQPPRSEPGTAFLYSNTGYILVGAMLEEVLQQPWEDLMESRLFEPLQMETAGFGDVGPDQPRPHRREDGRLVPVPPGLGADNPVFLGPAGTVHASLEDWAKFAEQHLGRGPRLLRPDSLARLHTLPEEGNYASGWVVIERTWADGLALVHAGSNTMNYAVIFVAPEIEAFILVACNAGDSAAVCDKVAAQIVQIILSKEDR